MGTLKDIGHAIRYYMLETIYFTVGYSIYYHIMNMKTFLDIDSSFN